MSLRIKGKLLLRQNIFICKHEVCGKAMLTYQTLETVFHLKINIITEKGVKNTIGRFEVFLTWFHRFFLVFLVIHLLISICFEYLF